MRKKFTIIFLAMTVLVGLFMPVTKSANAQSPLADNDTLDAKLIQYTTDNTPKEIKEQYAPDNWFSEVLKWGLAWISRLILNFFAWILFFAAWFFEFALRISVLEFSKLANLEAVNSVWQIARDISNMFFIFVMLYIAIGTVLDLKRVDYRTMIIGVVMAAVLINFSMLIAKLIIDPANIFALQFYNKIVESGQNLGPVNFGGQTDQGEISAIIVNALDLMRVYDIGIAGEAAAANAGASPLTLTNILLNSIFSVVMVLGASFVLFTAAFLLISRAIALVLLIAISPFPFLFNAIPYSKLQNYYSKWWSTLFNQAVWAPVYMFLLYFAIYAMHATSLQNLVRSTNLADTSGSWAFTFADQNLILFYGINFGFLLATIVVAKEFQAIGVTNATTFAAWANRKSASILTSAPGVVTGGAARLGNTGLEATFGESYTDRRDAAAKKIQNARNSFSSTANSAYTGFASLPGGSAVIRRTKEFADTAKEYLPTPENTLKAVKNVYGVDILTPQKTREESDEKRIGDLAKDIGKSASTGKGLDAVQKFMILSDTDKKKVYEKMSDRERAELEAHAETHENQGGGIVLDSITGVKEGDERKGGLKTKLSEEAKEKLAEAAKKVADKKFEKAGKEDMKTIKEQLKNTSITDDEFKAATKELAELGDKERATYYAKLSPENRIEFDDFVQKFGDRVLKEADQKTLAELLPEWRRKLDDEARNKTAAARSKKSMDELDAMLQSGKIDQAKLNTIMDQVKPRDFAKRINLGLLLENINELAPKISAKHLQELAGEGLSKEQKEDIVEVIGLVGDPKALNYIKTKGADFWL